MKPTAEQYFDRAAELQFAMKAMRDAEQDAEPHYLVLANWEQFLSDEWAARSIPYFIRNRRNKGKSDGLQILCNL